MSWKFRLTFWRGNYICSFSYGFGVVVRDIWEWRPGFYTEFRCGLREHSGLAWGAIFEKVTKYKEMHTFPKWACPKNPEMSISGKKATGGPAAETARSFSEETLSENLPPQNTFIFLITCNSHFSKKCCDWLKFTGQSQNFTENLNGPYGPYEHILQDRSRDLWFKKWVLDENSKFRSSEKLKIQFWDLKLTFWDWIWVRNGF